MGRNHFEFKIAGLNFNILWPADTFLPLVNSNLIWLPLCTIWMHRYGEQASDKASDRRQRSQGNAARAWSRHQRRETGKSAPLNYHSFNANEPIHGRTKVRISRAFLALIWKRTFSHRVYSIRDARFVTANNQKFLNAGRESTGI